MYSLQKSVIGTTSFFFTVFVNGRRFMTISHFFKEMSLIFLSASWSALLTLLMIIEELFMHTVLNLVDVLCCDTEFVCLLERTS